jgi:hypothetical protein
MTRYAVPTKTDYSPPSLLKIVNWPQCTVGKHVPFKINGSESKVSVSRASVKHPTFPSQSFHLHVFSQDFGINISSELFDKMVILAFQHLSPSNDTHGLVNPRKRRMRTQLSFLSYIFNDSPPITAHALISLSKTRSLPGYKSHLIYWT